MKARYLTKSRFKLGLECPTKLYYTKNLDYADQGQNDPFMQALAKGGYQVGEMAKFKYCDDPKGFGMTVETLDEELALQITKDKLLTHPNVVIAEGAFRFENLFIRADVVVRDGHTIKLIEVKSKSISNADTFFDKKGNPVAKWQPYLYDIAFQTYVMQKALPQFEIKPYLLLINKDAVAGRDGLNQLFKVSKDEKGRMSVAVEEGLTSAQIGNFDLLKEVPMGEVVQRLNALPVPNENVPVEYSTLERFIQWSADLYVSQQRHWCKPSLACKKCTFVAAGTEKKCGFTECWSNHQWNVVGKLSAEQLIETKVTDLWLGLGGSGKKVMAQNVPFLAMLEPELLRPENATADSEKMGMTPFERRSFQIEAFRQRTNDYIFWKDDFDAMKQGWDFPLNMIDFETSVVALPYFKGMAPYETVAFQFSHHVMHADGRVVHHNDFISWESGEYPNLEFVRALKASLESNEGTIFRYAAHENTVLNKIKRDIAVLKPVDQAELLEFIDSITEENIDVKSKLKRRGPRNMVDMADLVRKVYYSPHAGGSNSIKRILPAIIHDCPVVASRYSQPDLYGKGMEYNSRNFENHTWIQDDKNRDPYKTLLPLTSFDGITDVDLFDDLGEVSDGTAAMTAYNKLQWSFIGEAERLALRDALLQYCELDTLAMVMLMQGMMALDNRAGYNG